MSSPLIPRHLVLAQCPPASLGFLCSVKPLVFEKGCVPDEGLPAGPALVGLLPSVDSSVLDKE